MEQQLAGATDLSPTLDSTDPIQEFSGEGYDAMSIGAESRQRSDSNMSMASICLLTQAPAPSNARTAHDTFKTEYHPKSNRSEVIESYSIFGHTEATPKAIIEDEPYHPFLSRANFEFAELTHAAALSKEQTAELLRLISHITSGQSKLNFKSHDNVSKAWAPVATQMTPSGLPENGVPLVFILYADKTRLSSSGKVYYGTDKGSGFSFPLPDSDEARARYQLYKQNRKSGEAALKVQSWRPVENAFWCVRNSNPADAFCFDPLHAGDIGLWGDHLFEDLKSILEVLGCEAQATVDSQ
ncbi:hypothetical protein PAXRUDRAFT_29098 [Paxillus rubicundulus Ve08.2h10]|uniref:Uncharacterized protein n=1 Tax=Paxillus rubicundulus Ve08.2h10 TaxID=930991 RepID=A0A0D0CJC7_9AGAM|nr:hypothetical protein PAXRUDRAFT_29098 [Paxillus rubicundulus Ve08.2h10]